MRKIILILTALSVAYLHAQDTRMIVRFASEQAFERIVPFLNTNVTVSKQRKLATLSSGDPVYCFEYTINGDNGIFIRNLNQQEGVVYAEADGLGKDRLLGSPSVVIPNDEGFYLQYWLHNTGDDILASHPFKEDADMDIPEAWEIQKGSADITVAILDSGTDPEHPEFDGRLWTNTEEIPDNDTDDDDNGYVDDIHGFDFNALQPDLTDSIGHGLNVMGIIGANPDNMFSFAGIDWNCKLMPLKMFDANGEARSLAKVEGVYYAVENGADIINMSFGNDQLLQAFKDALDHAHANGVVLVSGMGNSDYDLEEYPAAVDRVIAVGATDASDNRAVPFHSGSPGSNYGQHIDLVAPGQRIHNLNLDGHYHLGPYWAGTSQASPMVAGVAALLLAQDPSLTPDEVFQILKESAEDQVGLSHEDTPGWDQYYGHGRINAHEALKMLTTSNLKSVSEIPSVKVWPNPVSNQLYLQWSQQGGKAADIEVYNLAGQQVFPAYEVLDQMVQFDLSALTPGIYDLVIRNQEQLFHHQCIKVY